MKEQERKEYLKLIEKYQKLLTHCEELEKEIQKLKTKEETSNRKDLT